MAAAVAIAAAASTAEQPAAPYRRPDLTVAKVVVLLCLTSLSAAFAAGAAAAVLAFAACGDGEACTVVFHVLGATCTRALLLAALLALIAPALVARAAVCDAGLREELIVGLVRHFQTSRAPVGVILREPVVRASLTAFAFLLLSAIGCLVLEGLSPAKGSRIDRIGAMLIVVGQVGSAAISCFIAFPLMGLKLWRMKLGGAAVADSNV
ncbi:unnamed protein product [Urochloa decumbens]|uniref:Uncharacterized protein n=1 Tax=Urochloa decumbens TaxID=240449 RepID=A0ABC9C0H1_9POAL